ncbi:hypothetical protein DFH11DRAFT_122040 [Phellopilus nigrolimitatus]|nr:hypothetical protein DFH11DRAFT_122040 [Phellopilus nigrolimitatus]
MSTVHPLATKGFPVFKPSMAKVSDFEGYMTRIECRGMHSGIVKIIPPKEWSDALSSVCPQLADVRIKSPIEQHFLGRSGLYRQQNIEKRKAISSREWAKLCAKDEFRARHRRGRLKAAGEHANRKLRRSKRGAGAENMEVEVEVEEVVVREEGEDEPSLVAEHNHSEVVPDADTPLPTPNVDPDADFDESEDSMPAPRNRRVQTRADCEAVLSKHAELDKAFLETFDAAGHWLPRNTSAVDYTPAFCATLEQRYWRNCGLGKPPWYGADTACSLFTEETTAWNVGGLPSTLSRLLPVSANGLPGINTPYLYFGMWHATFAWHVEDMDLFSINHIHFGAPKFWNTIPKARSAQLENTLRSFFPRDVAQCRQFL